MGSSFSSLNKSWGCTSLGNPGNRNSRKELTGLCRCPKNCSPGYTLPSPSRKKTSSLPVDELSTSIITSPAAISTYSCTCKNSLVHHHINTDSHSSNVDRSHQLDGVSSQGFIPTDFSIPVRVPIPQSELNHEQHWIGQAQCIEDIGNSYVVSHNFQDDLSSLAEHGWCFNMYLIHNKSTREAHSYLLASRLSTFDDLLTSLNRGKPHKSSNKAVATTDHIIASTIAATTFFNNTTTSLTNKVSFSTHSSINSLSMSDRLANQSFNLQPEKFPDLLSSSRLKLQDISSYDINNEMHHDHHRRKLPSASVISSTSLIANTTTHDISDSSEMFLTNFLSQLYTGNDPKQLLSKPDLLHQPEMKDCLYSCSNLLKLYNFLLSTPQHKCLLSSDCELIFTCPSIFNFKSITLPCHAGILACRSGFLRRILLKRCKSNTTGNTTNNQSSMIHKIILDGTILPAHFSTVLLHFFYCDYLNLNEIANLLLIFNKQTLLNKLHFNWHSEHESSKKSSNHDHYHTCCKVFNNEDHHHLTTSTYSHTYSSSCTESDSGSFFTFIKFLLNTSEFYVKQFCLQCPFCLTHIIQLHPIGAILEFHRLSEGNTINTP
ncbi:hypothetical protein KSF78_0001947 [Schistosoma japonicum]|nr:hypothetical protein KSF78_0001947 [Schistosoma japonicum]